MGISETPARPTHALPPAPRSSGRRPVRVQRHGVPERRVLPEQLQVPVHLPGRRGGLRAPLQHGRPPAQPRLPLPAPGEAPWKVLRGVGLR